MKGLTVADEDTLLDLAVEHVADAAAEKLGLTQGNNVYSSYKLNILDPLQICNIS